MLFYYPEKTFGDPAVIAPESVLSPILAIGNPHTLTVDDPTLTTLTWSGQGGIGGAGCGIVGSVCLAINILFAKTVLCPGVSNIVVLVHK